MSFNPICTGCGAMSGPSVGICPFCKSVMRSSDGHETASHALFQKNYNEGKLEHALTLGTSMLKADPKLKTDLQFVLPYVKVLIESEAPSSQTRSLLVEAHMHAPENTDVLDYLEILEAKTYLKKGPNDTGEVMLKNIIRRSPKNTHAHFILGTHLFWVENDSTLALVHLEACVRLQPNFLRAWGCLGAIYKKMGNTQLAQLAFNKCAAIETNPNMREFFLMQTQ